MSIVDYLYSSFPLYERQGKSGYKPGMENSFLLDEHLGHPHSTFKTIHVAGTNGKGSTSHILASVLQEQGYKVGLYTSPHLLDFGERIKVNGAMIPEQSIVDFVAKHKVFIESLSPSFFEVTTALAFDYFAHQQVDVAVIEVGLGGRLDCTNVITPLVSIITNISKDHSDLLGNTLTAIAGEKAGIIKTNVPVVIGETHPETEPVFIDVARRKGSPIYFADSEYSASLITTGSRQCFGIVSRSEGKQVAKFELDLMGDYQAKNIITVFKALELLRERLHIDGASVERGLSNVIKNTGLQGRWQVLATAPLTVCDTGHNEAGIAYVMGQIRKLTYNKLHILWGMVNDKDLSTIMNHLPREAHYYLTQPSIERAMPVGKLASYFEQAGYSYEIGGDVRATLEKIKKNAAHNDLIFIGGSTFVVADALKK